MTMARLYLISYFFGGAFLCNAIPHFVNGVTGHPFQSPFATPSGEGLSTSTVNVLWGFFNLTVAYLLLCRVGNFGLRSTMHVTALGLGFLVMGLFSAHQFGRFHGGNSPELTQQRPTDHTITKHIPGAFPTTGFEEHLRNLRVTQIVLTAASTR
jgi:hypothetical protein